MNCICGKYERRPAYANADDGLHVTSVCKNCGESPPVLTENKILDQVPPDHAATDLWVVTEIPDNPGVIVPIRKYIDIFTTETVWVRIPFIKYEDL